MLESLGFTPHEQRLMPWIFALGVLAMMLCFSILDYVDKNPSTVESFIAADKSFDRTSLPEVLRRLRSPSTP